METQFQIQSPPNLLLYFSIFFLMYLVAFFLVFPNWPPKIRPLASSCLISLAHGTPAVFFASRAIVAGDSDRGFASPNTELHNAALEFSIAYFLMDLLHYVVFYPDDVLFIAHHLATLFVFLTCRYVVSHGAYAILILLILAEITSPCQNVWTLTKARKGDSEIAAKVYDLLSLPFYAYYSIVRGFVGPYFLFKMVMFYVIGDAESLIPRWIWVSWIIVVAGAISVSILWIANLWVEFYRSSRLEKEKKVE